MAHDQTLLHDHPSVLDIPGEEIEDYINTEDAHDRKLVPRRRIDVERQLHRNDDALKYHHEHHGDVPAHALVARGGDDEPVRRRSEPLVISVPRRRSICARKLRERSSKHIFRRWSNDLVADRRAALRRLE